MSLQLFLMVFGWPLLSAALNQLFAFKTPEQYEAYCAASPRGAQALKLLRKVGLDLPGLLRIAKPLLRRALGKYGFKGDVQ